MNKPLSIHDVSVILDKLTGDLSFKIYLLDKYNKKSMFEMVKRKSKNKTGRKDYFMILYDLAEVGHWCCMVIDYDNMTAYFYCSFGIFIDDQFNYRVKPSSDDDNDLVRSMLRYLYKNGFEVHYNNVSMQDISSSVCGRYCAVYIALNEKEDVTPDEFNMLITESCKKENITPDELILDITSG